MSDDFDKWVKQWDKAQKSDIFDKHPEPPKKNTEDFFGGWNQKDDKSEINDLDYHYWDDVYRLSQGEDVYEEDGLLMEEDNPSRTKADEDNRYKNPKTKSGIKTDQPTKESKGKRSDHLFKQPNPVQYPTVGKDGRRKVTPNWTDGEQLEELNNLKKALHNFKAKLTTADAEVKTKEAKKLKKEIEKLEKKADELSDMLNADFWTDYLS